jgi:hypothetical protein
MLLLSGKIEVHVSSYLILIVIATDNIFYAVACSNTA